MVIKPLEKSNKGLKIKIILILCLIILAIFLNNIYSKKKNYQTVKNDKKKEILGEAFVKDIKKSFSENINKGGQKIEEVTGDVLGEVTNVVTEVASKSAVTISDFLFENTVGNVLKQIDRLPEKDKEKIKEKICQ